MAVSLYTALALVSFIALSVHVVRGRFKYRTALLDGGHTLLSQRIRAQGNFAEYTPIFLIALGLAEHQGLAPLGVHALGIAFFAGRGLHAYSLLRAERYESGALKTHTRFRATGMAVNFTCLGILAVMLGWQYIAA